MDWGAVLLPGSHYYYTEREKLVNYLYITGKSRKTGRKIDKNNWMVLWKLPVVYRKYTF